MRRRGGLPVAVIDNTLLSRLDRLEIAHFLPLLFKQILIPPEVKREANKGPHKAKRRLQKLINELSGFFVNCRDVDDLIKEYLKADLDEGEASAIAQADYHQAVVLVDEKKGFERAVTMQLTAIRTPNLLNQLKEAGAITAVKPYYVKLVKETGFYFSEKAQRLLLLEAGEE